MSSALRPCRALTRRFVDALRPLDRDLARFFVDELAVRELLLDDVDLLDVLQPAGHTPVCRQTMQRTISAMPWSITSAPAIGMTVLK